MSTMCHSRSISACTAVLSLWVVVLMGGMTAQDLAVSSAAPSVSGGQANATVHASASLSSALLPEAEHLPVVGDLRLVGDSDGEEPSGRTFVSASSVARSVPPLDRISRPGRTPLAERSCSVLCVFLC